VPQASATIAVRSLASPVPPALTAFGLVRPAVATNTIQAFIDEADKQIALQAHASPLAGSGRSV
jgi:hypothetical protein